MQDEVTKQAHTEYPNAELVDFKVVDVTDSMACLDHKALSCADCQVGSNFHRAIGRFCV